MTAGGLEVALLAELYIVCSFQHRQHGSMDLSAVSSMKVLCLSLIHYTRIAPSSTYCTPSAQLPFTQTVLKLFRRFLAACKSAELAFPAGLPLLSALQALGKFAFSRVPERIMELICVSYHTP